MRRAGKTTYAGTLRKATASAAAPECRMPNAEKLIAEMPAPDPEGRLALHR
jgi:hypothetical protein